MEEWKPIPDFEMYDISTYGRVRNRVHERILTLQITPTGLTYVGLWRDGVQDKRSVPLLVARAFIPQPYPRYNTPVNVNGDRTDNHYLNLQWRPRWFAIMYNHQFKEPYHNHIPFPIQDVATEEITDNSLECARTYCLLEKDIVLSIVNRTVVWPTYQEFRVVGSTY